MILLSINEFTRVSLHANEFYGFPLAPKFQHEQLYVVKRRAELAHLLARRFIDNLASSPTAFL